MVADEIIARADGPTGIQLLYMVYRMYRVYRVPHYTTLYHTKPHYTTLYTLGLKATSHLSVQSEKEVEASI